MLSALVVPLFLLAPLGTPEGEPSAALHSVLVLDLKAAGIDAEQTSILNDIVGQSVGRYPNLRVITTSDVRRMSDLEAARSLLGCDDTSCLAELAGDFGARYVLYGSVASLGGLYVIQLTLFDSERAEALKRARMETKDLAAVTAQIDAAVEEVCAPLVGATAARARGEAEMAPTPGDAPLPIGAWITVAGVGAAVIGAAVWGMSAIPAGAYNALQQDLVDEQGRFEQGHSGALETARGLQARADQEAALWATLAISGAALSAVGLAVAVTGAVLWLGE